MGLIPGLLGTLFGGGRNVITEAAEVFRVNAEESDARQVELRRAVLEQFAAEFNQPRATFFDRLIDGMNRLPRPLLALGTVALATSAMVDPVWFAARMQGVALVPEPLWWLLGAIISFYFGARYQAKGQDFQRSIAASMAHAPQVVENLQRLHEMHAMLRPDPTPAPTLQEPVMRAEPVAVRSEPAETAPAPSEPAPTEPAPTEPAPAKTVSVVKAAADPAPAARKPVATAARRSDATGPNAALDAWRSGQ